MGGFRQRRTRLPASGGPLAGRRAAKKRQGGSGYAGEVMKLSEVQSERTGFRSIVQNRLPRRRCAPPRNDAEGWRSYEGMGLVLRKFNLSGLLNLRFIQGAQVKFWAIQQGRSEALRVDIHPPV